MQEMCYVGGMTTSFYVVHFNRATRSLDGLSEFQDFDAAKAALDEAQLAHLSTGDEVEIALVPESELHRFLGAGDVTVPAQPTI